MRHRKATSKLGRKTEHRQAMLANQVCSLIQHERIRTTLAKAKAVRPLAEKMVTLAKDGGLHARRNALAVLHQKEAISKLFGDIAKRCAERNGGYTRIIKLGKRLSDAAPMALIEWVDGARAEAEDAVSPSSAESAPKSEKSQSGKAAQTSTEGKVKKPAKKQKRDAQ
jgi:large subunit ribosomal protein L17